MLLTLPIILQISAARLSLLLDLGLYDSLKCHAWTIQHEPNSSSSFSKQCQLFLGSWLTSDIDARERDSVPTWKLQRLNQGLLLRRW